jgi:hypothetical protein
LGIGRLILETDALKVKQAIASEEHDRSVVGGHVEELKVVTQQTLLVLSVFILRFCNKAAHVLAALGVGSTEGEEHMSICHAISRIVSM